MLKETSTFPSLIVGATNILGDDWLPGAAKFAATQDDASFFAVSSFNLLVPPGPPSWTEPLIRLHLGWGTGWHDDRLFGGAQFMLDPKYGCAILNYKNLPAYICTWKPYDWLEASVGALGGDSVYRVGGFLTW